MASWHPYNRNGLTGTMCLRYEGFSRLFCVLLVRPLPNTGADGRISACKARFTSFLQLAGRLPVGHRRFPVRFQCAQQPAPVRFQHRINRLAPLIALACLFPTYALLAARLRSLQFPPKRFTSFALSGIQTPILCKGFHNIHRFITPSRMYQNREGKYVIQRGLFSTEINISGDRHPRLVYRECNADGVGRNPARSAYPAHLSRQRSIPDRRAGRLEAEAPLGKLGLTGPCAAAAGRPSA